MRVWHYWPGGVGNEAHADNTLLTISPAGTRVGLGVRVLGDGRHVWPEARMADGECLLFAGDALGVLTRGAVPALLHWVEPPKAEARMSMPFFLRPRLDALLDPARVCRAAPPADAPRVDPLRQRELEQNAQNVRWRWPWKRTAYYRNEDAADDERWQATTSSSMPRRQYPVIQA